MPALYSVQDLSIIRFNENGRRETVLNHVSFDIHENEWTALTGDSGEGKTTLLNAMMGFLLPDFERVTGYVQSGDIRMEPKQIGIELLDNDPFEKIRGKKLTYVMQNSLKAFDPTVKIGRQIEEILPQQLSRKEKKAQTLAILERLQVSDCMRVYRSYPMQVNMGTLQKIMIAMALLPHPDLILLDEPFANLDLLSKRQMIEELKKETELHRTSVFWVTHEPEDIRQYCGRYYRLNEHRAEEMTLV